MNRISSYLAFGVLASMILLLSAQGRAADLYDDAVQHSGRSAEDLQRDAAEHPAEILRLASIKPGMKVADVMASGGYYSELLSYIVGPKGHVLLLNNTAYDKWSEGGWEKRLAGHRLPNVEHRTVDLEHLDLPDHSLDALLLIKVYHDFYWVDTDPKAIWPKMDAAAVLDQLARVLKPGGLLLVEDHSAKPGTGSADAGTLHRIDEAYAVHDFEKRGFKVIARSDLLRRPDDKRELVVLYTARPGKDRPFCPGVPQAVASPSANIPQQALRWGTWNCYIRRASRDRSPRVAPLALLGIPSAALRSPQSCWRWRLG